MSPATLRALRRFRSDTVIVMSGTLIETIHDRLDELERDATPEQAREIRELQQLFVGLRDAVGDDRE